jgi:hypothetical protein
MNPIHSIHANKAKHSLRQKIWMARARLNLHAATKTAAK